MMVKLKSLLNLYFGSWKRSFDFKGKEIEGEYKAFTLISLFIGIMTTLIFKSSYETSVFLIEDNMNTINCGKKRWKECLCSERYFC